ncbi:CASP-like protein 1E1, partial [Linum perenne]
MVKETSVPVKKGISSMVTMIMDMLMVGLRLAGIRVAAIPLLGKNGNSHVRWNKMGNVFGRFCN